MLTFGPQRLAVIAAPQLIPHVIPLVSLCYFYFSGNPVASIAIRKRLIFLIQILVLSKMLLSGYPILLLAIFVLYAIGKRIQSAVTKRQFARRYGCKNVTKFPQSDPILGTDWFLAQLKAYKSNEFLEAAHLRYEKMGLTFSGTTMGRVFLLTVDPENIRAMLATQFGDFGLGPRIHAMGPFLGSGIFTTDGKAWEHSRVHSILTLRP